MMQKINDPLAAAEEGTVLAENEVKDLLHDYGIPTPQYQVIQGLEEVDMVQLRYPLALKACQRGILHKTELGGVVLNIRNREELVDAYAHLCRQTGIQTALAEEMVESGLELIIGVIRDSVFGLCIMVGLGGVFAEVLEDVAFRKLPITRTEAEAMLTTLKGARALRSFRGLKLDREAVVDIVLRISRMALDHQDRISQLDLNPVILTERGVTVVDAKLLVGLAGAEQPCPQRSGSPRDAIRLNRILAPRSVAIVGASANPSKRGHLLVKNLLAASFPGKIFPVNPKAESILGLAVAKSVLDIPSDVDLALIAVGAKTVPLVLKECGCKKVGGAVVFTSGFRELGKEGEFLDRALKDTVDEYDIPMLGPNCQGVINTVSQLVAAFDVETLIPHFHSGPIAIVTQSGSVGSSFIQAAIQEGLGFSVWVNLGNKLDIEAGEVIRWLNQDPNTSVIAAYLEDVRSGDEFVAALRELRKPLVMLKAGRTVAGQKAARSHTAALAGDDMVFRGVLAQHGVFRVRAIDELFDLVKAFSFYSPFCGKKLLIVESSGGLGTIASDLAFDAGLELPAPSAGMVPKLQRILPPFLAPNNPLDLASVQSQPYECVAELGLAKEYDGVLLLFGDPVVDASHAVAAFKKDSNRPIVVVFSGGGQIQDEESRKIKDLGVPVYSSVERGMLYFQAQGRQGTLG